MPRSWLWPPGVEVYRLSVPSPLAESYRNSLPDGWASYPEVRAKGAIFAHMLGHLPRPLELDDPPPEIALYLRGQSLPSSWYPEVHQNVLFILIRDHIFAGGDRRYLDWAREMVLAIFETRFYYRLMNFLSPEALLRRGPSTWSQFHRGIDFGVGDFGDRQASAALHYPAGLLTPMLAKTYVMTFEAALRYSGAAAARGDLVDHRPTEAHFRAHW